MLDLRGSTLPCGRKVNHAEHIWFYQDSHGRDQVVCPGIPGEKWKERRLTSWPPPRLYGYDRDDMARSWDEGFKAGKEASQPAPLSAVERHALNPYRHD